MITGHPSNFSGLGMDIYLPHPQNYNASIVQQSQLHSYSFLNYNACNKIVMTVMAGSDKCLVRGKPPSLCPGDSSSVHMA